MSIMERVRRDQQGVVETCVSAACSSYFVLCICCCWQVLAFNGTPVLNLQHLAQMVTACQDTHLRFDCEYYETIVLDRQQAAAGTADVLKTHSIPAAMSADLQQALQVQWPPLVAAAAVEAAAGQQTVTAAAGAKR
jgi:hypothetical protein